jgi:hypothetical protein
VSRVPGFQALRVVREQPRGIRMAQLLVGAGAQVSHLGRLHESGALPQQPEHGLPIMSIPCVIELTPQHFRSSRGRFERLEDFSILEHVQVGGETVKPGKLLARQPLLGRFHRVPEPVGFLRVSPPFRNQAVNLLEEPLVLLIVRVIGESCVVHFPLSSMVHRSCVSASAYR